MHLLTTPTLIALITLSSYPFSFCDALTDSSQMVDVGGYSLNLAISGKGSPTVVFESGMGATMQSWGRVQAEVAKFTQVVTYDRAGMGKSEHGPLPRSSERIAVELQTALKKANVTPPYVLVGHSIGGIHIRVFAKMYPKEVAGIVLIDPSSEDFFQQLKDRFPELWKKIKEIEGRGLSLAPQGVRRELEAIDLDVNQAKAAWPLPAVPVVLITSMYAAPLTTPESRDLWLELHKEFLTRVPNAKHVVTEKTGHFIHSQEPELVIEAIRDIVNQVNRGK
jgi:pimeloyl-ACP methyl ester carboxylesterase